jgi:hypothetical protein
MELRVPQAARVDRLQSLMAYSEGPRENEQVAAHVAHDRNGAIPLRRLEPCAPDAATPALAATVETLAADREQLLDEIGFRILGLDGGALKPCLIRLQIDSAAGGIPHDE